MRRLHYPEPRRCAGRGVAYSAVHHVDSNALLRAEVQSFNVISCAVKSPSYQCHVLTQEWRRKAPPNPVLRC